MTAETQTSTEPTTQLPHTWQGLVDLGFSVFPIPLRSKKAAIEWRPYQSKHASREKLVRWAAKPSNIAIAAGEISGVFILDLDSPEAVEEAKRRGLPDTASVITSRGQQFYFKHPGTRVKSATGILPKTDIKGDGGYVLAPGSIHPSGHEYEWDNDPAIFGFADAPQWLLDLVDYRTEREAEAEPDNVVAFPSAYGKQALKSELEKLKSAAEGTRNDQLNRSAFAIAQLVTGGELDADSAKTQLREAALAAGLEPDEIETTIASGWQAGIKHPREAPNHRRQTPFQSIDPETGEVFDESQFERNDKGRPVSSRGNVQLALRLLGVIVNNQRA